MGDAILMARLHRTDAMEMVEDARNKVNDAARQSATAAVEYADKVLMIFHETQALLPDLAAARDAKLIGDVTLLQSGSFLIAARRALASAAD